MILLYILIGPTLLEPVTAHAEPLSAEAFDQYTRGKTLFYGAEGAPYGAERYMEGRRVVWTFLDGKCQDGEWYENQIGHICFVYENNKVPQCWSFEIGQDGLIAQFENNTEATILYEANEDGEEMLCRGPNVGV